MLSRTSPTIQNTSYVDTSRSWMPEEIGVSIVVSKTCYRGFVIYPLLLILLDDLVVLQGTKVLEDKEVRFSLSYTTEDTPQQHASPSVLKYTGTSSSPEWTDDVDQGSVFSFNNIVKGAQTKQTSSRRYVLYEPTSPPLRIKQSGGTRARYTTPGTLM